MYAIKVRQGFSAAHYLKGIRGKCEEMHGHNNAVEVTIESDRLKPPGLVADFVAVKRALRRILPDHKLLNDVMSVSPTAEHIARYVFDRLATRYPVARVRVWENDDTSAEYVPDRGV
jgi:6-pyruvoyltetrahydropterin/6-carboxytetrahydropterin synthase